MGIRTRRARTHSRTHIVGFSLAGVLGFIALLAVTVALSVVTVLLILGAGIIAIIENIIVLFGVSPYWQGIVSGAIVVLAISFDAISRRYLRQEAV